MSVNMQYVGFTAKAMVRGYTFLLRESSIDSHEITFTILNEAFTSHRPFVLLSHLTWPCTSVLFTRKLVVWPA
jgi:hypothetical protein